MDLKNRFATRSLFVTFGFNLLLLVAVLLFGGEAAQERWLVLSITAVVLTFGLWLALQQAARPLLERAATLSTEPAPETPETPPEAAAAPEPETKPLPKPEHPYEASAVQMLSILQRKGRLIDFLQEDIQPYSDDQIGAAVRNVHEGCREALREAVELEPIYSESEGSQVTVEPDFDSNAVRLTGQVAGDPPFSGQLQHRGWRVRRIDLPEKLKADDDFIVAPAEVEV